MNGAVSHKVNFFDSDMTKVTSNNQISRGMSALPPDADIKEEKLDYD